MIYQNEDKKFIGDNKMNPKNISRRNFLKTAGAGGIGAVLGPKMAKGAQSDTDKHDKMPTRPFGRSGIEVPILSMGGMFDIPNNQLMLKQAIRLGVTYWDTANSYGHGVSETGIGQYFTKYPEERKKIFLVTKSGNHDPDGMTEHLNLSLKRMNTDTIDLFFMHSLRNTKPLKDKVRAWAEKQKAAGKIRLFGFSTHSNMEKCLSSAAGFDWIDGIMMTYNFRLMHTQKMKDAVNACVDAGIGLTAMKTQGGGQLQASSEKELLLGGRFLEQGFTQHQAKLKAVWENNQISAICSMMENMTYLMTNTAAALDKTRLSAADLERLALYADSTACSYCTGCGDICEKAVGEDIPIADVMRYLMYAESYGDWDRGAAGFQRLPEETRRRLAHIDYGKAERRCPQQMAIGELMRRAQKQLA